MPTVTFRPANKTVVVPAGALVTEALREAGLGIAQPCGGQGRCGRCAVQAEEGHLRRRSTIRLSPEDLRAGYALACQAVIEADTTISLPPAELIERRLMTDKSARQVALPFPYHPAQDQTVRAFPLALAAPTLADAADDYARLERGLAAHGVPHLEVPLPILQKLGATLREANWQVTAVVELDTWRNPAGPPRLIDLLPGDQSQAGWGVAIDIGTTTVTVHLVNLVTGAVVGTAAEYNAQIAGGEDVIARIVYASQNNGLADMGQWVRRTINDLLERLTQRQHLSPTQIYKASVVGNTTMVHLFLGLPPATIRLSPYVPTVNHPGPVLAGDLGLTLHPRASVDCLPGVASYVGADITAGVLASGLPSAAGLTLFIDVGTNGEIVLGTSDWLATCACSAGPAFEGAGVVCGMRATRGAIEEVWINSQTLEPTIRVIGHTPPTGLCGSGLISLLAELFINGVIDKGGHFNRMAGTHRVRPGAHGLEYLVVSAAETMTGADIVLTQVDVENLMRAKAAIYAGFMVLAQSVGVSLNDLDHMLIGGAFGQYLNIEKAVQIGLLPDLPWEKFNFLGNTAVLGAYMALLSRQARAQITAIAQKMTYLELSADNSFYEAFNSALFLPHTNLSLFPTVAVLSQRGNGRAM